MTRRVARLLTGGQSGADRAATDVAIAFGVPYGGWVPRGGWAEDFAEPPGLLPLYPEFRATSSSDPAVRTERNVLESDATLLFVVDLDASGGSRLAWTVAGDAGRGRSIVNPFDADATARVQAFAATLEAGCVLHVAGARASECAGIYDAVTDALRGAAGALFDEVRARRSSG